VYLGALLEKMSVGVAVRVLDNSGPGDIGWSELTDFARVCTCPSKVDGWMMDDGQARDDGCCVRDSWGVGVRVTL